MQQKRRGEYRAFFILPLFQLLQADSLARTYVSTSAAFDADFGIDFILAVAFADGGNGALSSTCTAADAFFGNFVSHLIYLLIFDRTFV